MSIFNGDSARYNFPCGGNTEENNMTKTVWILRTVISDDWAGSETITEAFSTKNKAIAVCIRDLEGMTSEEVAELYEDNSVIMEDGTELYLEELEVQ